MLLVRPEQKSPSIQRMHLSFVAVVVAVAVVVVRPSSLQVVAVASLAEENSFPFRIVVVASSWVVGASSSSAVAVEEPFPSSFPLVVVASPLVVVASSPLVVAASASSLPAEWELEDTSLLPWVRVAYPSWDSQTEALFAKKGNHLQTKDFVAQALLAY